MDLQDELSQRARSSGPSLLRSLRMPLLMSHGGRDNIACGQSTKAAYHAISSQDKNIIAYDECSHQMLSDGDWIDIITNDTVGWQNAHI